MNYAENKQNNFRTVRSFVRRKGRMTNKQKNAIEKLWKKYGIDFQNSESNFVPFFENKAPIVLEIGFGMGLSLIEMAKNSPNENFIGVEVHQPGIGSCLALAEENQIQNLRIISHDAIEVLEKMIADDSITKIQLFFPDPWHKTRHHKRRIVQPDFVQLIHQKLTPNGLFHLATDWENYAKYMLEIMTKNPNFKNLSETNSFISRPDFRPLTKFEQRGQKLGLNVWDLIFEKK